jgi:hypothetical protein
MAKSFSIFTKILIVSTATLSVLSTAAFAHTASDNADSPKVKELCTGFLPENDMQIPVGFKSLTGGGITETQFNDVIDRAVRLFAPVVAKEGGRLSFNRKWTDATVNASAQQMGSSWIVNMYGGLARHPATSVEGFALVVCHELGHHLGGAPKIKGFFGANDWATNEGGSDYYAGLKCLRVFFAEDDNATIVAQAKTDGKLSPVAEALCDQEFSKTEDQLLCKRTSVGGTSVAGLFQALRKEPTAPDFGKPDTRRVAKTDDKHPATQCRMDTYLAGAICNVDVSLPVSNTDYRQGSCVENVAKVGVRPRCWFAP